MTKQEFERSLKCGSRTDTRTLRKLCRLSEEESNEFMRQLQRKGIVERIAEYGKCECCGNIVVLSKDELTKFDKIKQDGDEHFSEECSKCGFSAVSSINVVYAVRRTPNL